MVNLFSLPVAKGVTLSSNVQISSVKIGKTDNFVDKSCKYGSTHLLGIKIYPTPNHVAATAQNLCINIDHDMFVHPSSQVVAATDGKLILCLPKS
jgi:hypothetical protein